MIVLMSGVFIQKHEVFHLRNKPRLIMIMRRKGVTTPLESPLTKVRAEARTFSRV